MILVIKPMTTSTRITFPLTPKFQSLSFFRPSLSNNTNDVFFFRSEPDSLDGLILERLGGAAAGIGFSLVIYISLADRSVDSF